MKCFKRIILCISQPFHLILKPAILLKKRIWHRCFPVSFTKILRTPFLQNTYRAAPSVTLSRRRSVSYRNQSIGFTGFYMIGTSIMKELKKIMIYLLWYLTQILMWKMNTFSANVSFTYPLKTSENQR